MDPPSTMTRYGGGGGGWPLLLVLLVDLVGLVDLFATARSARSSPASAAATVATAAKTAGRALMPMIKDGKGKDPARPSQPRMQAGQGAVRDRGLVWCVGGLEGQAQRRPPFAPAGVATEKNDGFGRTFL